MSIRLMTAVWDTPTKLDPTTRLVLLSLADQASDEGWCWPSLARTARRCGVTEETVRRHVVELERLGFVTRFLRSGTSTKYLVHATPLAGEGGPGSELTPHTHEGTTPLAHEVTPPSPTRGKPSVNPKGEPKTPTPSGRGEVDALPGMPQEQPTRTAGDLVRSWVDAYTLARGSAPLASQVKRTASSARKLADDLEPLGDAAWSAGLELARLAGRDGYMDLIAAIPRYHRVQPSSPTAWWVQAARSNGEGIEA